VGDLQQHSLRFLYVDNSIKENFSEKRKMPILQSVLGDVPLFYFTFEKALLADRVWGEVWVPWV